MCVYTDTQIHLFYINDPQWVLTLFLHSPLQFTKQLYKVSPRAWKINILNAHSKRILIFSTVLCGVKKNLFKHFPIHLLYLLHNPQINSMFQAQYSCLNNTLAKPKDPFTAGRSPLHAVFPAVAVSVLWQHRASSTEVGGFNLNLWVMGACCWLSLHARNGRATRGQVHRLDHLSSLTVS